MRQKQPIIKKFLQKITVSTTHFYNGTSCWEWTGYKDKAGYGRFTVNGNQIPTHRFSYEYYHGQICPDLVVHHLCYNPACNNVSHLEERTRKANVLDENSSALAAINARKTHCIHGHEYTLENTSHEENNKRRCIICRKLKNNRYYAEKKYKERMMA